MKQLILALLVCAAVSHAQLQSIYRNTKEVHRGTAAQREAHSCQVGDLWFTTDAAAGQNWYGCTGPNVWAQLGGKLPFIDVTAAPYNAKGDGTTDDTEAIQAAITALSGGGTIFFPIGTYRITSQINIPANGSLYRLVGANKRESVLLAAFTPSVQSALISADGTSETRAYVQLDDLFLEGNSNANLNGVYLNYSSPDNVMRNCIIYGFNHGIVVGNNYGLQITDTTSSANLADGIILGQILGGGMTGVANHITLIGSTFSGNGRNGIYADGARALTVVGGDVEENTNAGIKLNAVKGASLSGTYTEAGTGKATEGQFYITDSQAVVINGVNVSNWPTGSTIIDIRTSEVAINGLSVEQSGSSPISATGVDIIGSKVSISGSHFDHIGTPIWVAANSTLSLRATTFGPYYSNPLVVSNANTIHVLWEGATSQLVSDSSIGALAEMDIAFTDGSRKTSGLIESTSGGFKSSTLSGTGNRCLETDANGNIVVAGTGAACGSGSGGSGTFQSLVTDLKPTNTSTVLTIAAGRCAGTSKSAATATITAGTGNGSYAAYCTDTQAIVVEHSTAAGLTITCSGCTASQVTTPSIPFGMQPIATGTITTGAWGTPTDARNGIDLAGHRHQNGTGMAVVCESGTCLNQVNTATVQMKSENYTPVADFDASGATKFVLRKGAPDPATCTVGEKFYNTISNTEKTCTAANTWTTAGGTGTASANGVYLQISGVNYLMPGMYAATLPSTTGFTWTNQASATATADSTTGYALVLNAPGGTSGWHIYKKSLGASTKVTVAFACYAAGDSGAQSGCGFGVSASGTSNALEMLRLTFHNSAAPYRFDTVSTYTNPTSFNANLGTVNTGYLSTLLTYAQLQLSGGTLTFRTSPDGTNWTDRYSGTAASDLGTTPTEWWVGPLAATGPAQMVVYSMKEE